MSKNYEIYRMVGHRLVGGWLFPEVLAILKVINSVQRVAGVSGAVSEIGVHHGKLFIGLALLQDPQELSVAIDVFGEQELNVDKSGRGDMEVFLKNVMRWAPQHAVVTHQGDSTKLTPEHLHELAKGSVRLFSVDGGHTESTVFSDMRLAESVLADGGVVIADDVFNQQWPEVFIGTWKYMNEGGKLIPFAIGFNKVFFATPPYAARYRNDLMTHFGDQLLVMSKTANLASYEVIVITRTPRNRLKEWYNYHH